MPTLPPSPLEDPDTAAHAWARYRRLMRLMMTITLLMVGAAFVAIYRENGVKSAHIYVATALMVGFAMLLMSALMGLVFLSSGTGHDEAVVQPSAEDDDD
jgi:4-hydroxybenzoate polyprenyltransferase